MSKTLHFQTKRIVEFHDTGNFNYGMENFHYLCDELGIEYTNTNETYPEYDEDFELTKDSVRKAAETLKAMEEGKETDADAEEVTSILNKVGMGIADARNLFETLLSKSEPNSDFIFVNFF